MNKIIIVIFLLLILIYFIIFYNKSKKPEKTEKTEKINKVNKINKIIKLNDKPYLWLYWEGTMPPYIDMCKETIYKHCSESFNIIFLNNKNIYDYLPQLKNNIQDFSKLKIAQKVDYYRILLLYTYGGLYLDMDIICMKDPIEIINKLENDDNIDYVGFGCTGNICKYGYSKPSNSIMASKSNTQLMKNILNNYENKINKINSDKNITNKDFNYHDFGKLIIWEELDNLIKNNNYKYFHYPNTFDGSRDTMGRWVHMGRLFSDENIKYDDENNLLFVLLYNSDLDDVDKTYRYKICRTP
jgi:uncharacterized protein YuzB (UPF0349 family)